MATFTFTISATQLTRISNALDIAGYKFDSTLGTTDNAQRLSFFKKLTIKYWQDDLVFNSERRAAIALEPNDSAALQMKRFIDLSDVTTN